MKRNCWYWSNFNQIKMFNFGQFCMFVAIAVVLFGQNNAAEWMEQKGTIMMLFKFSSNNEKLEKKWKLNRECCDFPHLKRLSCTSAADPLWKDAFYVQLYTNTFTIVNFCEWISNTKVNWLNELQHLFFILYGCSSINVWFVKCIRREINNYSREKLTDD